MAWRDVLAALTGAPIVSVKAFTAETIAALQGFTPKGRVGRTYESLSRQGYEQNMAANRAISEIANGAASAPLLVFRGDRELEEGEVVQLLRRPNFSQGRVAFMRDVVAYYLLAGDSFVASVSVTPEGPPRQLHALRPDRMMIQRRRLVAGGEMVYTYKGGEDATLSDTRTWTVADIDDRRPILHLKTFAPLDDLRGLPPLVAARASIDRHNLSEQWNSNLIRQGDSAGGLLSVREGKDGISTLDDATRERVIRELEEKWSGPRNAGRPRLIEGNLEWVKTQLTPREMEWTEANYSALRFICAVLGYPPFLLGIPGDNTYSNQREARAGLWEDTIVPTLSLVLGEMAVWLGALFNEPDLRIVPDLDRIPALAVRREQAWERVKGASWLTTNEKRNETGFEDRPEPEADEILVPATETPLSLATEPPAPPPAQPAAPVPGEDDEEASARIAAKAEEMVRLAYRYQ